MSEREPEPPGPDGGWGWIVCLAAFYCVSVLDGELVSISGIWDINIQRRVQISVFVCSQEHLTHLEFSSTHLRLRWAEDTARWSFSCNDLSVFADVCMNVSYLWKGVRGWKCYGCNIRLYWTISIKACIKVWSSL